MRSLTPLLLVCLFLATGCPKTTVIGTPCQQQGDCNVAGQVCAPGRNAGPSICTRSCTGQVGEAGCPIGYDCSVTDPNLGLTCNKATYAFDPDSGRPLLFGRDCSLNGQACDDTGDPNAEPSCRKLADYSADPPVPTASDPNAYCTGACESDDDCPIEFECLKDYDEHTKCLRRRFCSECNTNDNCPKSFPVCVPTRDGTSAYCTKPCSRGGDCGGAQNTFQYCTDATDTLGNAGTFCLHKYGACLGSGEICDPCRSTKDCEKSKSSCVSNDATGERFCTKKCSTDGTCASTNLAGCDTSYGICNGDPEHRAPGTFSCWL